MSQDPEPLLPLSEATFYMLLSLATGRKHGYAILKQVETLSRGRVELSTSTLYTTLLRLQDQGLIERVDRADDSGNPGLPRKTYQVTGRGRRVLEADMTRLRQQVQAGQQALGPGMTK